MQEYCVSPAHLRPRDDDVDYYCISIVFEARLEDADEAICSSLKSKSSSNSSRTKSEVETSLSEKSELSMVSRDSFGAISGGS